MSQTSESSSCKFRFHTPNVSIRKLRAHDVSPLRISPGPWCVCAINNEARWSFDRAHDTREHQKEFYLFLRMPCWSSFGAFIPSGVNKFMAFKKPFHLSFHYSLSFFAVTFLITTTVRARDGGERNESLKKQFWATFINVLQCIITRVTSTACLRRIYYGPWRIDLDEATQACLSTCCHSAARISAQRQFVNWSVFRC